MVPSQSSQADKITPDRDSLGLIFLEMASVTRREVFFDSCNDVDIPSWDILHEAGILKPVLAVMCEMSLAGFRPNVMAAVCRANLETQFAEAARRDMSFSSVDIQALTDAVEEAVGETEFRQVARERGSVGNTLRSG